MIHLTNFCSPDLTKYRIHEPFSRGEYSYATDGNIIVRVPRRDDIAERASAPDVERLFDKADRETYEWQDVPDVEVRRVDCDCCEACRATVAVRMPIRFVTKKNVEIGLSNIYLELIRAHLPACQIGFTDNPLAVVKLRFDGGEGLLMPMRLTL